MATVGVKKGRRKEEYCEHVVGPLWVRVGLVFESGNAPKNAQGMLRHPASPGRENKWEKFYFPKTGANTNLLEGGVSYAVPASMKGVHHGELLLALRGRPEEVRDQIFFGRHGEDKPFEFNDGTSFLTLWIMPKETRGFDALYIRNNGKSESPKYFALMIDWIGDNIEMNVDPVDIAEVPPHLIA